MHRSITPTRARRPFDASVDHTNARKATVRRFGRSDRRAQGHRLACLLTKDNGHPPTPPAWWPMFPFFHFSDNCRCKGNALWLGWRESQADDLASPGEAVLMPTTFESPAPAGGPKTGFSTVVGEKPEGP
jgi:hypothetical protein